MMAPPRSSTLRRFALSWLLLAAVPAARAAEAPTKGDLPKAADDAKQLLDLAGVRGGLAVHVGCGDGRLIASLAAIENLAVEGLDADTARVVRAREHLAALGLHGKASVQCWQGDRLPYAENMVNLLIVDGPVAVPEAEILRVLVPGGVACARHGGSWRKLIKRYPSELDQWTHWLHDAGNNAVAHDACVGPPRSLKWVAEPLHSRGHETTPSVNAMVTGGGRIFYVLDEGQPGVYALPSKWFLVARDAFNGLLLWRRPVPEWLDPTFQGRQPWGARPRRLVVDGQRVFLPLGPEAVLSALDAATGKTICTFDAARDTIEIRYCGRLLLVAGSAAPLGPTLGSKPLPVTLRVATTDHPDRLKLLWQSPVTRLAPQTLAIGCGQVYYYDGEEVVALDALTGGPAWRTACRESSIKPPRWAGPSTTLVVHGGTVYLQAGITLAAFSADTGKLLWRHDNAPSFSGDLFAAAGLIWQTGLSGAVGRDAANGEIRKTIDASSVFSQGHHLRCYRSKATDDYIITPNRGAEFVSLISDRHVRNDWLRGVCGLGVMPANGLLYAPPNQCFCYGGVLLTGFKALSAGRSPPPIDEAGGAARLERGQAYAQIPNLQSLTPSYEDWPMYRGGPGRLGATPARVPADLHPRWRRTLGGRLTPPVAAGGMVLVAAVDAYTIHALDAADGRPRWSFAAGGRIDSPPTLHRGLVLFGCADGWMYCLRAVDGALAWRFRAAPADRRIGAFGRIESAWPVHGSVLILDGLAYCTAGRSTYLDGGIRLYGLDPATGRVLHRALLSTTQPPIEKGATPPFVECFQIEGASSDLLVSDGRSLYLGQFKLNAKLAVQPAPYLSAGPGKTTGLDLTDAPYVDTGIFRLGLENRSIADFPSLGVRRGPMGDRKLGRHLLATGGFLDDTWFNRTYWMYAENWPGYYIAHLGAKTGQLLAVDATTTYGVQAYPSRTIHSPTFTPGRKGYLLFADDNDNEPVLDDRTRDLDKGMGYTRAAPPKWFQWVPVRIRAMLAAKDTLLVAGPPDVMEPGDPYAAFEGRRGAVLWSVSTRDGKKLTEMKLDSPPVFDGMAAAGGSLYLATVQGTLDCYGTKP